MTERFLLHRHPAHHRHHHSDRGATVLLAEDDDDVREGLASLLRFDGYRVRSARTGTELLEVLATALLSDEPVGLPFDILVTDVRMPGFDGLRIVENLRAEGWTQPAVIISGYVDLEMRHRLAKLSGVALLEKPFDAGELETTLTGLTGLACAGASPSASPVSSGIAATAVG